MEKALLIVSFGTSCPEVLERDIVPVERAIQEALRGQGVRELLVQPTFLLRGREYDMLMR